MNRDGPHAESTCRIARRRRSRPRAQAVSAGADRPIRLRAGAELESRRGEHAERRAAAGHGALHPRHSIRTATTSSSTHIPNEQEKVYPPLLGEQSSLTGRVAAECLDAVHERTLRWVAASATAGRPWVVANDEQGTAGLGVPPDPGYKGFNGKDRRARTFTSMHDIRKYTLWGNLMAGGAGVEYYFGYSCRKTIWSREDFRSRDKTWDYGRIALDFFRSQQDSVLGDEERRRARRQHRARQQPVLLRQGRTRSIWCICRPGGTTELDLSQAPGNSPCGGSIHERRRAETWRRRGGQSRATAAFGLHRQSLRRLVVVLATVTDRNRYTQSRAATPDTVSVAALRTPHSSAVESRLRNRPEMLRSHAPLANACSTAPRTPHSHPRAPSRVPHRSAASDC